MAATKAAATKVRSMATRKDRGTQKTRKDDQERTRERMLGKNGRQKVAHRAETRTVAIGGRNATTATIGLSNGSSRR